MKLFKCLLLSAALTGGFLSCSDYDDAWIKEAIDDLKGRVTTLEEWCKTANSNISALQTLVSALEKSDYVTGIVPVTENGKEIGYTLSFKNSPAIIIYHGKNGTDGQTPVIGVAKAADGLYYWTQKLGSAEATFILDEKGNKMPASGSTATATAPRLSVDAEGYWMIDTNGEGFVRMKDVNGKEVKATGADGTAGSPGSQGPAGDSIYDKIDDSNPDYVIITLKDGTVLMLAKVPYINVKVAGGLAEAIDGLATPITSLTIVGTLGDADFTTLKNLSSLKILDISNVKITVLPERALEKSSIEELKLPNTLKEIQNSAFYQCASLKSLDIPKSVEKIGRWIVEECSALTTITLHEGLKTLSESCFYGANCSSVTIPSTVTEIPAWAFQSAKLTSVVIPATVISVGEGAFSSCEELVSTEIKADLTEISEMMFAYCPKLATVNIPANITSIGEDAFCLCPINTADNTLVIPSKVKTIGARAFSGAKISGLSLPEGLETIRQAAFNNTNNLTEVTLPASLKKLSDSAFFWNKSSKLTFLGTTPPEIIYTTDTKGNLQMPTISGIENCKVFVPAEAVDAYKASVWGTGSEAYGSPIEYFKADNISAIVQ